MRLSAANRGPVLMSAAMALFTLEDMFLKTAMAQIHVGLGLMIFGAGGLAVFLIWARLRGEPVLHPAMRQPPMLWRSGSEVMGRLFYTLAFALAPLSLVTAILQATPLVVALGAVVFFAEQVGWRRWLAIASGFLGVLIILRPGTEAFDITAIFALLGMLGFAGRDLATRASPASMTNAQLGVLGFAMLIVSGLILTAFTGLGPLPDPKAQAALGAAVGVGVLAYTCLTASMRVGEVSLTVPWRYTRLVFAMVLGMIVFGERPDAATLIGSAIIVLSGLYTLHRATRA